jgi:ATP-dependent DNA helicase RecQ
MGGRYPSAAELERVFAAFVELRGTGMPTPEIQKAAAPVAKTKTRVALSLLKESGIVKEERPGRFTLLRRRLAKRDLAALAAEWQHRDERDRDKLDRMESYARTALCRWRLLREYFGEEGAEERCGVCDNCRKGLAQRAETSESLEGTVGQEKSERPDRAEALFAIGDSVVLPSFGAGQVEQLDGDSIVVRFPGGRARKFKREFARPVPSARQKR